jgi:metal-responsive CopG/Arc/MetJ family transcriptional regulator
MKTIQITIDEPLLEEVDRLIAELKTTRSAFIREALLSAIRRHTIAVLEKQDEQGYARHPVEPGEFDIYVNEQAWNDE